MSELSQCKRHRTAGRLSMVIGLGSLLWLLRSAVKPSRIAYPCQQAAAANASLLVLPGLLAGLHRLVMAVRGRWGVPVFRRVCVGGAVAGLIATGMTLRGDVPVLSGIWSEPTTAVISGARAQGPPRVVSVHDAGATSWNFSCTSTGPCPVYYGDDTYVDQTVVDEMVDRGLTTLTDTTSVAAAWQVLIPAYQADEIVAIKLNFNDSIMGGGVSGYGDNDAYVDALPQIVNALVRGLVDFGVPASDIRLYDASRYLTDRFRALIDYPVAFSDLYGNGSDVQAATFDSIDPSAVVDFSPSGYSGTTHKIADLLVTADYLINIPIMKRHGGAGITLCLKNHLGTVNGFVSGWANMHSAFYLSGGSYSSSVNPIVDINANPHIRDKTVLNVGDALYGGWPSNNVTPQRWSSFGNDSPNMLFFGVDPVAVDSVMYDYLVREGSFDTRSEDILEVADAAGLGVHERWNNATDRQYTTIDYVELDLDTLLFRDGFESGDLGAWSGVVTTDAW